MEGSQKPNIPILSVPTVLTKRKQNGKSSTLNAIYTPTAVHPYSRDSFFSRAPRLVGCCAAARRARVVWNGRRRGNRDARKADPPRGTVISLMVAARWDQRREVRVVGDFVEARREVRARAWGLVGGRRAKVRAAVPVRRVVNGFRSILAVFERGGMREFRRLWGGREVRCWWLSSSSSVGDREGGRRPKSGYPRPRGRQVMQEAAAGPPEFLLGWVGGEFGRGWLGRRGSDGSV